MQDIAEMSTVEAVPAILDILEDKTDLFTSEKGRSLMSSNTPVKLSLLKTYKQVCTILATSMLSVTGHAAYQWVGLSVAYMQCGNCSC